MSCDTHSCCASSLVTCITPVRLPQADTSSNAPEIPYNPNNHQQSSTDNTANPEGVVLNLEFEGRGTYVLFLLHRSIYNPPLVSSSSVVMATVVMATVVVATVVVVGGGYFCSLLLRRRNAVWLVACSPVAR